MIVATRHHGNRQVELRRLEAPGGPGYPDTPWTSQAIIPGDYRGAVRIAAVACAVRLVTESAGSFIARVATGDAGAARPLLDAPQARVLQDPGNGWTSFDLWADLLASIELDRFGLLWKTVTSRGVDELFPIPAEHVRVVRAGGNGARTIEARIDGRAVDVTRDVIYVRSWAPGPRAVGESTVELASGTLRSARAYEEFRGRYFDNDATPGVVLTMQGNPNREQRRDLMRSWLARHAGPMNVNRPAILWGGVELDTVSASLRDAQAAEIADPIIRDVARAFRIYPASLLHLAVEAAAQQTGDATSDLFMRFTMMPRLRRIERALSADRDLFPDPNRYLVFDSTRFLRGDLGSTAKSVNPLVQSGTITKNEGRAMLGLPPVAGGDVFQVTPVGGAPNPDAPAVPDAIPATTED